MELIGVEITNALGLTEPSKWTYHITIWFVLVWFYMWMLNERIFVEGERVQNNSNAPLFEMIPLILNLKFW